MADTANDSSKLAELDVYDDLAQISVSPMSYIKDEEGDDKRGKRKSLEYVPCRKELQ